MNNSATEIIKLYNAASASPELTYEPVWISTDRREQNPAKTTLKYSQIGGPTAADKIGNALGPIYMLEFVDLTDLAGQYIKIWGLDNDDINAPVYPVSYLVANPKMEIWLKKFEITDADGLEDTPGGDFVIYGYRKRTYPAAF